MGGVGTVNCRRVRDIWIVRRLGFDQMQMSLVMGVYISSYLYSPVGETPCC